MPSSDWYHLKLRATSRTPMIVQVRLMPFLLRSCPRAPRLRVRVARGTLHASSLVPSSAIRSTTSRAGPRRDDATDGCDRASDRWSERGSACPRLAAASLRRVNAHDPPAALRWTGPALFAVACAACLVFAGGIIGRPVD